VGAAVLIAAVPIVLCSAEIARTFAFFTRRHGLSKDGVSKDGISKMAVKDESLSFHSELAQSSAQRRHRSRELLHDLPGANNSNES
jgi:hypothetical protein